VADEVDHKLYARIICSMCLGGYRLGMFGNCPYCDLDRKTFVEASLKTIKTHLDVTLSREEKEDLIKFLSDGSGSDSNYS